MNMTESKNNSFFRQCAEFFLLLLLVFCIRTFIFGLYVVPTGSMENTMLVGERFLADKLSYWFRAPKKGEIVALIEPGYKFSTSPAKELFERYVYGPQNWTKRIIAGPNEHIRGSIENGVAVIYVNDVKLNEPYLNKYPLIVTRSRTAPGKWDPKSFDVTLPLDQQPFYDLKQSEVVTDPAGNPIFVYPSEIKKSKTPVVQRGNRFWDGSNEFSVQLKNDEFWLMGDNRNGSSDSRFFGPVKLKNIFARISLRLFSVDSDESWLALDMIKHPIKFWGKIRTGRSLQFLS